MRLRITLILTALVVGGGLGMAQTTWDDFDNPENCVYGFFDGTSFDQMFSNPATGGVNTSALCAEYGRNPGAPFDVIIIDPPGTNKMENLSDYVSGAKTMSLKVYSPAAGLPLQITLEDGNVAGPTNFPAGRHSEYTAMTTVANQWETLTFTFSNRPDVNVPDTNGNRLVLLFEPNTNSGNTFLFDDLMGPAFSDPCGGAPADPAIADDVECQRNVSYTFTNGTLTTGPNPNPSGINTSSTVGRFQKFVPPTNDGAFGGDLAIPFTTATYNTANIQLYDQTAPQDFVVILQDANGMDLVNTTVTTTSTTAWESFAIDLSSIPTATSIEKFVLLLNPTTDTEDSIYFDNFTFSMEMVSVDEEALALELSVAPVPFTDQLTLRSDKPMAEVTLTDITGRTITELTGLSKTELEVSTHGYPAGAYFITIRDKKGNQATKKIFKL
ncbi:MAG: T9SS type A sorting domain-containing protein [Bacteroidota bacterium]